MFKQDNLVMITLERDYIGNLIVKVVKDYKTVHYGILDIKEIYDNDLFLQFTNEQDDFLKDLMPFFDSDSKQDLYNMLDNGYNVTAYMPDLYLELFDIDEELI